MKKKNTTKPVTPASAPKAALVKGKKKCRAFEVGHRSCDCGRAGCGRTGG